MPKYLLKKFLSLSELPQGIVFLDEYPVCCRSLVLSLIKSHLNDGREVHYFCFSIKPEKIEKFTSGNNGILTIHDFYSDPLNWLSTGNPNIEKTFNKLCNISENNNKIVIVIDSINSAADFVSETVLFRHLQKLKSSDCVSQVIVYCYNDIGENYISSSVMNMMPAVVRIHSDEEALNCSITWHKKNNKVVKSNEEFRMSENFELQFFREVKSIIEPDLQISDSSVLNIETTFNLSLTDAQKEARKRVVLPHTRIQSVEGHISYIPDESDDWDDEDPDADLEL